MTHLSKAAFFLSVLLQMGVLVTLSSFMTSVTPLCMYSTLCDSVLNGNLIESGNSHFLELQFYAAVCMGLHLIFTVLEDLFFLFFASLTNSVAKGLRVRPFL